MFGFLLPPKYVFRSIDPKFAASGKPVANLWKVAFLGIT